MNTLLVMTTGQTDVQLIKDGQRHKFDGNTCGTLHDAIKERSWSVVESPRERSRDVVKKAFFRSDAGKSAVVLGIEGKAEIHPLGEQGFESRRAIHCLPEGKITLCTPKLDAVLAHFASSLPSSVLILETTRQDERDPHLAGEVMERRLRDCGVNHVTRAPFLTGNEQLEDRSNNLDAIVRRAVVDRLSNAIREAIEGLTRNDRVFVATTGGLPAANELINELVRLHCVDGPTVTGLEVPDENRAQQDDRAVEEKFHPAAGYRARWHALSLVEKGNLLGAWGAVSHLEGEPGQEWTQVIKWLANFASSLPLKKCELSVLHHPRMAVRAALRVELSLRAGDIPRAVHGTVAFFEAAFWDWLRERDFAKEDGAQGTLETGFTFSDEPKGEKRERFIEKSSGAWRINDFSRGIRAWLPVLNRSNLCALWSALDQNDIHSLRNDVAHNEPTPELMKGACTRMRDADLWSSADTFLSQSLIQAVLEELGVENPELLLANLLKEVRRRLGAGAVP